MSPIITISGFSGVGKSTLLQKLHSCGAVVEILSHTTRHQRGSKDDRRIFVSEEVFQKMQGENRFCQVVTYDNKHYGLERARIQAVLDSGATPILDVAESGVQQIRNANMAPVVSVFLTAPPSQLLRRLIQRSDPDPTIVRRRLEQSLEEALVVNSGTFHYVFRNDDVDVTANKIIRILQGHAVESDPFDEESCVFEMKKSIRELKEAI